MDQNVVRADVLPDSMPLWLLALLAALGVAAWVACHWALRRYASNKLNVWQRALAGFPAGLIGSWLVLQFAARLVFMQTPWPLILVAAVSAASLEAVSAFYVHECARISPRSAKAVVAFRMGAVALTLFVLAQPVVIGERSRTLGRRVVVLVDDSASMHFKDGLMTDEERADAAKALGVESLPETTRSELVRGVMEGSGKAVLDRLAEKYSVDVFRFGGSVARDAEPFADRELDAKERAFRSSTDISRALELVLEQVPSEEIVSVVMFTDGRHNGGVGVDSVARRFGSYGIPVHSVVVGGTRRPFDLALAAVDAPESVFLGDKVRVTVSVSASRADGRRAKLVVSRTVGGEGEPVEVGSKDVEVSGEEWSGEFKFTDVPGDKGVYRYHVALERAEGELFDDNNDREVDVAVSDDRTNVLLVDGRPRWEYRYLRNLFYGRDKSVHLQDWIVRPDTIAGIPPQPLPPASADRPFGESEAEGFPMTLEEWLKFDVIIIGDVGRDVLTEDVEERIKECVERKGALLVLVSGSEHMPCEYGSGLLRDMMPAEIVPGEGSRRAAPENDFRLSLAPAGRGHPVMSQSSSAVESEDIWNDVPDFHWRLPVKSVAAGADVLAYAKTRDGSASRGDTAEAIAASVEDDPEEAMRRLEAMRNEQANNALVVASAFGKGKVLMLLTDSMWRLRSKQGDQVHHRFWGQVMRWGAGERLRAGNKNVRLGTDQLRYGAGEKVEVRARFLDWGFKGIDGLEPRVMLTVPGEKRARALTLTQRPDGNGFYSCELDDCTTPGEYGLSLLTCEKAKSVLRDLYPSEVETTFSVVTSKRAAEDVDVTATRGHALRIAKATGARVMSPAEFAAFDPDMGEGSKSVAERVEFRLWSLPPLFLLVVGLLTAEWITRKKASLA